MNRFLVFLLFVFGLCDFVAAESWDDCFFSYQKFLHEKFDVDRPGKTDSDAEKEEKRSNHRKLAERYAEFSDKFAAFARRNDLFPPTAPSDIKREKSQKITGTWNLYKNVPINARDLWQEACYMKFRSLHHAAVADPEKLASINDYAAELEKHESLNPLFQTVKRTWYGASLRLLDENAGHPEEIKSFESLVADYVGFLNKYPSEENLNIAEPILALGEKVVSKVIEEQLRQAFEKIQRDSKDPDLRNLAEVLQGVLRRQGLLGQDLPIWGHDVNGKPFDPKVLDGKVVLLDFWATWCGPCIAEFPRLKKLYEKYREKGFEIVGYCVDSDAKTMYNYLERNPLPWIVLAKETSPDRPLLSSHYGAKRLPVVLLRDRNGKAVLLDASGEKLDEMLEKLFGEPGPVVPVVGDTVPGSVM